MKINLLAKKSAAIGLSLCMLGGLSCTINEFAKPAIVANAADTCYAFDESTGQLTLKGNIVLDEISNFADKKKVLSITAEKGTVFPEDCTDLFNEYIKCNTIDLSNADTSNVTIMSGMFRSCTSLEVLDISSFDTSKVTMMDNMFSSLYYIRSIDLKNFDTSNVTNMENMFFNCVALEKLDLSSFDISNVTDMKYFFNCSNSLTELTLSSSFVKITKALSLDNKNATKFDQNKNSVPFKTNGWANKNDTSVIISGKGQYAEFTNTGVNTYIREDISEPITSSETTTTTTAASGATTTTTAVSTSYEYYETYKMSMIKFWVKPPMEFTANGANGQKMYLDANGLLYFMGEKVLDSTDTPEKLAEVKECALEALKISAENLKDVYADIDELKEALETEMKNVYHQKGYHEKTGYNLTSVGFNVLTITPADSDSSTTTTSAVTSTTTATTSTTAVTTTIIAPVDVKAELGDLNGDKVIDASDASFVLRSYAIVSSNLGSYSEDMIRLADVNGDKVVDARDASDLLSFYAGASVGKYKTFDEYLATLKKA